MKAKLFEENLCIPLYSTSKEGSATPFLHPLPPTNTTQPLKRAVTSSEKSPPPTGAHQIHLPNAGWRKFKDLFRQ